MLQYATTWGSPLFMSSQDVETAFDFMNHASAAEAMLKRGLHPGSVLCLLRELSGCSARITLPGAGETDPFAFSRGGK